MSGKFMKIKKIIIPTITMVIIASQLFGCSCSTKDELNKMINNSEEIVIEVAEPDFEEQGTESKLVWTPLAELTNYASFREGFDKVFGIEQTAYTKTGILYIDSEGNANGNNTLYNVFTNKSFVENYWNNEETQDAISALAVELYADVDENSTDTLYATINAYFNLLADNEVNYYNGQASLSRAEAMTMLMRATTPVETLKTNSEFTTAVGTSDFTDYASYVADDSYLTIADKSLNNQTFNGTITRGEFIYMVVNNIFGSDIISNTDISNVSLKDCKATTKTYDYKEKSYIKSYDLSYAIQSPDEGAPADLYRGLAVANKLGVISSETRWDEALTKSEAVEIIIDAILAHNNLNGYSVEVESGVVDTESIEAKAEAAYAKIADKLSISVDTYISEYKALVENGSTHEQAEAQLSDMYTKKEVNTEQETEPETTKPSTDTQVDPTKLEPKGEFTKEVIDWKKCTYKLTWENGAVRYAFIDATFGDIYYISDPNVVPQSVFNEYIAKLENSRENTTEGSTTEQETTTQPSNEQETTSAPEDNDYSDYFDNDYNPDYDPDYEYTGPGGIAD